MRISSTHWIYFGNHNQTFAKTQCLVSTTEVNWRWDASSLLINPIDYVDLALGQRMFIMKIKYNLSEENKQIFEKILKQFNSKQIISNEFASINWYCDKSMKVKP